MSALAARRAAAIASGSNTPSPAPSPRPRQSPPSGSKSAPRLKTQAVKSKRAVRAPFPEGDTQEVVFAQEILDLSSKRRKIEKSPPAKQRYFVEPDSSSITKGKQRAFSPSIPIPSDTDDQDSSDGGSDIGVDDLDQMQDGTKDGRVRWDAGISAPSTPRFIDREAGPSKYEVGSSRFTPKEGVNMVRISEDRLRSEGSGGDGPGVVISLSAEENLLVTGSYTITVLQGSLCVSSTTISPSSIAHPILAPTSHPIPVLSPSPVSRKSTASTLLDRLDLPSTFIETSPQAVFLIREHHCGLEGLRHGAVPGFAHTWLTEAGLWGLRNIHPVIGSFSTPVYPHITPTSWTEALGSLAPSKEEEDITPTVVLVKGPKRTGKSTLARSALNELLTSYERVAWLECDLGQGEFGPGGLVGLWIIDQPIFGPPYSHPRQPHRAHYLGTYTPLTCPDEFIAAIRHLLDVYKYDIQYPMIGQGGSSHTAHARRTDTVPLVLNTQGWVKGLGEDLLRGVEAASTPSHIFAFETPTFDGFEEDGLIAPQSNDLIPAYSEDNGVIQAAKSFVLESAPISPLQARYTSADMRILSMITYLHANLSMSNWNLLAPLPAVSPLEVSLGPTGPLKEVYMIGEGSEGILSDDLAVALNGAIVALGRNENPSDEIYVQGRQLPLLDDMNIFGLGLVRGIRRAEEGYTIHLITPLGSDSLAKINCIIRNGAIELPLCGLTDWRYKMTEKGNEKMWGMDLGDVPFLQRGGGGGVGVERKRVRRNLQRRNV